MLDLAAVKEWRQTQHDLGQPCGLMDYFAAHGRCFDCHGSGAEMIGMSPPTPEEADRIRQAGEEPWDELPLYEVCATCGGTGDSHRSQWRKMFSPKPD